MVLQKLWALWSDDSGYMLSSESVLLSAVMTIGVLGGLVEFRNQTLSNINEMTDSIKQFQKPIQPIRPAIKSPEITSDYVQPIVSN